MLQFGIAQDSKPLTHGETWLWRELKRKILGWVSLQRTISRQRSRILRLQDGVANTSYFNAHASKLRRLNHLFKLKKGNMIASARQDMEEVAAQSDCILLKVQPEGKNRAHGKP